MLRQRILAIKYIRKSLRRNNSSNYNIKDFLDRSLSRLRELFKIIRKVAYLRVLVRLVVRIRVYFYFYFSINS